MQPGAALVAEVAHLLGGAALALAFALLTRRRLGAMVAVVRAQSGVVALAVAWQAWAGWSPELAGLAVALLTAAVALPWALTHAGDQAAEAPPVAVAVTVAAGLVVLAMLVALPAQLPGMKPLREDLALAVATILVGLLVPPTRRAALPQLAGLLAVANGVALAASVVGASLAVPLAIAVAALFVLAALGLALLPPERTE